jgi:hypothetical protein
MTEESTTRYDQMLKAVEKYHNTHPEVWELFNKFTAERIAQGFKNYSVNGIFERIRWETPAGADGTQEFKIGNNFRAFYARAWMEDNPEHEGFFRTRKQKSKNAPPRSGPEQTPGDI